MCGIGDWVDIFAQFIQRKYPKRTIELRTAAITIPMSPIKHPLTPRPFKKTFRKRVHFFGNLAIFGGRQNSIQSPIQENWPQGNRRSSNLRHRVCDHLCRNSTSQESSGPLKIEIFLKSASLSRVDS